MKRKSKHKFFLLISGIYIVLIVLSTVYIFAQTTGLEIGNNAPEINLPDTQGKIISLSSLRGKLVLIDFWGTWCIPCVKEQPELSGLYKRYKDSTFTCGNGFEIYGVSLDNKKKSWMSIIKKYHIDWIQVSDLLFWTSPVAKDYNIQELPFNVLIDGNGVIIVRNLHGHDLENQIIKLLKK